METTAPYRANGPAERDEPETAPAPPRAVREPPADGAESSSLRDVDRLVHAAIGGLTFGISPVSLLQAWQDWAIHLAIAPGKQGEIGLKAVEKWSRLARHTADCACGGETKPCISPLPQDRRFADASWRAPPFSILQQSFLLAQQWWHNSTSGVPGVAARHQQLVEFHSRQWLDMLAPSNFPATNPQILERAIETGGANFLDGLANLADDLMLAAGLAEPKESPFRPGRDVAVTPGDIVYRNEMIELIRYRPTTREVMPEPILIVPAWIMKYYILDLSPGNSLVRHLVDAGFEVFCISWRNPSAGERDWSLDDYRRNGLMAALDVASGSGRRPVHAAGYCLGGTLLAIAAATMARDADPRLRSVSLLASLVDFHEPGEIGLFIDEAGVSMLEDMMWSVGYLDQRQMAGAFRMLRSRDLLWSRIVHDYLMGERAPRTDLMAWNADATRMPYRMHSEYLRSLYIENRLAHGRFEVGGRTIHLEDIAAPVFAVGTTTDHVAPWRSVFELAHLMETDVDFVLTNGGHNAGIVSEPGHHGRNFRHLAHRHGEPHPDPDAWAAGAAEMPGSWWPEWVRWLKARSGEPVKAAKGTGWPVLGTAPGEYVLEA